MSMGRWSGVRLPYESTDRSSEWYKPGEVRTYRLTPEEMRELEARLPRPERRPVIPPPRRRGGISEEVEEMPRPPVVTRERVLALLVTDPDMGPAEIARRLDVSSQWVRVRIAQMGGIDALRAEARRLRAEREAAAAAEPAAAEQTAEAEQVQEATRPEAPAGDPAPPAVEPDGDPLGAQIGAAVSALLDQVAAEHAAGQTPEAPDAGEAPGGAAAPVPTASREYAVEGLLTLDELTAELGVLGMVLGRRPVHVMMRVRAG